MDPSTTTVTEPSVVRHPRFRLPVWTAEQVAEADAFVGIFGLSPVFDREPTKDELEQIHADLAIEDAAWAVAQGAAPGTALSLERMSARDLLRLDRAARATERTLRPRRTTKLVRRVAAACSRVRSLIRNRSRSSSRSTGTATFARSSSSRAPRSSRRSLDVASADGAPAPGARLLIKGRDLDDEGLRNLVRLFEVLAECEADTKRKTQ